MPPICLSIALSFHPLQQEGIPEEPSSSLPLGGLRGCLERSPNVETPRGASLWAAQSTPPLPAPRGHVVACGPVSPPRRRPTGRLYIGGGTFPNPLQRPDLLVTA